MQFVERNEARDPAVRKVEAIEIVQQPRPREIGKALDGQRSQMMVAQQRRMENYMSQTRVISGLSQEMYTLTARLQQAQASLYSGGTMGFESGIAGGMPYATGGLPYGGGTPIGAGAYGAGAYGAGAYGAGAYGTSIPYGAGSPVQPNGGLRPSYR